MGNSLIADLLVIIHLAFIAFVIFGGLLVLKWKWLVWLHIPAAIWGALIEFFHWVCPLTPLENHYRKLAGDEGYSGGFIDHYIIPMVYPTELTPTLQFILGISVVIINLVVYLFVLRKFRKTR